MTKSPRVAPLRAAVAISSVGDGPSLTHREDGSPSPLSLLQSISYDVVPARELPTLNPVVTIKKVIVPQRWLPSLNSFLRRRSNAIALAYVVGLVCRTASVLVPVRIAKWTALATLPLQVLAVLNVVLQFRIAFFQLLVFTYDFWFYLAMNIVWATCLIWYFADCRAVLVPLMCVDVQNSTLLDAFLQDFRIVISAAWVSGVALVAVVAAVALDWVESSNADDPVFVIAHRTITVKEMLLNAVATVAVLLVRILYRRRAAMRIQQTSATPTPTRTVQSIALTWPLKLEERSPSSHGWQPQRQLFHPTKLQLQLTLRCKPLKASDVVTPLALSYLRHGRLIRIGLYGIGLVGLIATPIAVGLGRTGKARLLTACISLVCTSAYCVIILCFYQRKLIQQILWSFDFAFISLTTSTVLVCVADLFQWETTTLLCLLSAWLWLHLVMTRDALTPVMRRVLIFCEWAQVLVLLLAFVSAVLIFLELSMWDSLHLMNRRFFSVQLGQRTLELHVVPCLLSRLFTVCLWALRSLFRLATRSSDHDLLFIQSHVEFDARFHQQKRGKWSIRHRIKPPLLPEEKLFAMANPVSRDAVDPTAGSVGSSTKSDKIGLWLPP